MVLFKGESYKNMHKILIFAILRAPSSSHQWVCLQEFVRSSKSFKRSCSYACSRCIFKDNRSFIIFLQTVMTQLVKDSWPRATFCTWPVKTWSIYTHKLEIKFDLVYVKLNSVKKGIFLFVIYLSTRVFFFM